MIHKYYTNYFQMIHDDLLEIIYDIDMFLSLN